MGGLADGGVIHFKIAADGADNYLTRIQAHADLDGNTLVSTYAFSVTFHRLLHSERGIAGANGVVFVSKRRTEQRHDAVAHDLVYCALVAMNSFHHELDYGIEELPCLFRVTVSKQFHGSLEISEKNSHLFSLTLERTFRRQDLLGQMFGCIALWSGEARCSRRSGIACRMRALRAELGGGGQLGSAVCACT